MSGLTDEDRERARQIAAEMPDWTDEQLAELAALVDARPRDTTSRTA